MPSEISPQFIRVEGDHLLVMVDARLYSVNALQKTAHRFTDRCAVHLSYETETLIAVRFHVTAPSKAASGKAASNNAASGSATLKAPNAEIAEAFLNELLDQTLRESIGQETEGVRNLLLAHALSETSLIHPELEDVDPRTDPLEIARTDTGVGRTGA